MCIDRQIAEYMQYTLLLPFLLLMNEMEYCMYGLLHLGHFAAQGVC